MCDSEGTSACLGTQSKGWMFLGNATFCSICDKKNNKNHAKHKNINDQGDFNVM